MPYLEVAEGLLVQVERGPPDVRTWLLDVLVAVVGLDLGHVVRRYVHDGVGISGPELGEAGLLVRDGTEHDLVEKRRAVPILVVALHHDANAVLPLDELERAGTDGVLTVVLPVLLYGVGAHDPTLVQREAVEERRVGRLQDDLDRRIVGDLRFFD